MVCIDTPSPTLPTIELDAVLAAIVEIHFIFDDLISPEYDCRLHLPHEEDIIFKAQLTCRIILHRQVKT